MRLYTRFSPSNRPHRPQSVLMLNAPTSGRPHCSRILLATENYFVILLSVSFVRFKVGILLNILLCRLKRKVRDPYSRSTVVYHDSILWHTLGLNYQSYLVTNYSIDQWWPLHRASETAEILPDPPPAGDIMYYVLEITRYRSVDQCPESVLVMSCYHLGYVYTNKRCCILRR
jgi:hypothetical protein